MQFRDYYRILGVARTATRADIKRAYRAAARAYHPDVRPVAPDAVRRFQEANEAHAVLADAARRARYDALAGWSSGVKRSSVAREPGRPVKKDEPAEPSDFFRAFFGESGPFGAASPFGGVPQGANGVNGALEATAELSLEGAYVGVTRIARIDGRRVRLEIPRGVDTGSQVCVPGALGARALVVTCVVHPHPTFTRYGANLARELPITLVQALRGARVPVPKPKGQVMLTIPPGTKHGTEFVLPGHGMPRLDGPGAGVLRVRVAVQRPETFSDEELAAAEEFLGRTDEPDSRSAQGLTPRS